MAFKNDKLTAEITCDICGAEFSISMVKDVWRHLRWEMGGFSAHPSAGQQIGFSAINIEHACKECQKSLMSTIHENIDSLRKSK